MDRPTERRRERKRAIWGSRSSDPLAQHHPDTTKGTTAPVVPFVVPAYVKPRSSPQRARLTRGDQARSGSTDSIDQTVVASGG